jgi:hypothetical protein
MKTYLKSTLLIFSIILFCLLPSISMAEELQLYSDAKNHFQINYPKAWIKGSNKQYNVTFQNKTGEIIFGIQIKKNSTKQSAGQILDATEKLMKLTNIAEVKSISAEQLKSTGASDNRLGVYEINNKQGSFVGKYFIFTNKDTIYILKNIIKSGKVFEENGEILEQMVNSFKIK